jgi:hypothetical protein
MSGRQATVFACDDLLISLTGKFNALGIYTGDIVIPNEITAHQIVFVFQIEFDIDDPMSSAVLEVKFPGEENPRQLAVPVGTVTPVEGRSRWIMRWPFAVQTVHLRPGCISTKVIHDKGEIDTTAFWIVSLAPQSSLQ